MFDQENIPRHVAIIMDGNGRWAKERGLPRTEGHREGMERAKEIIEASRDIGIKFLTYFAFSAENWKRPKVEINILMRLLDIFLQRNIKRLIKNDICLKVIGRKEPIPGYLWKRLLSSQAQTKTNKGLTVILAFNYGSRQEIVDAARKIAQEVIENRLSLGQVAEGNFSDFLYTAGIPDPDLLIRTSAEMRISNFLLWQLSYTELYFPKVLWPDFKRENLEEAIREYQSRSRRFGGL